MQNYLYINKANIKNIILKEPLAYENDLLINRIWYSADADLIEQIFKKTVSEGSGVSSGRFWSAIPSGGLAIRKIHCGLPQVMINVLSDLIISDMGNIKIDDDFLNNEWQNMENETEFKELIQDAVINTLVDGDGAFKIYMDNSVSEYPIVDFYSGTECETEFVGNRVKSVTFYTKYNISDDDSKKDKMYTLKEVYGVGYINYELYNEKDILIDLDSIEQTASLIPEGYKGDKLHCAVIFDKKEILAVPVRFWKSTKFQNRGKSIYDSKTECFDRLDEAYSAFADFERDNRQKNYIPKDLLQTNPETGETLKPNPFNFRYIAIEGEINMKDGDKIATSEYMGDYNAHIAAINSAIDAALLGIIAPATLGINIAANSSGESQKEKKDITAITRNHITTKLEKVIKDLVRTVLDVYTNFTFDKNIDFCFGEYGALDFGSKITLLASARPGTSIISLESIINELWGDSKDDDWKKEELERLQNENGVTEIDNSLIDPNDLLRTQEDNNGV